MRIFTKQDLRGPGFLDETQFVPLRDVHDQAAALAALNARVAELEAKLANAREEALEEAARLSDNAAQEIIDHAAPASAVNALRWQSKAIRAMKGQKP